MNKSTEAIVRELMEHAREANDPGKKELADNLAIVRVYYLIRGWHEYLNKTGVTEFPDEARR